MVVKGWKRKRTRDKKSDFMEREVRRVEIKWGDRKVTGVISTK